MGKRKDTSTEEEVNVDIMELDLSDQAPHKKHKKHKHKKHKKKKTQDGDEESPDLLSEDGGTGSGGVKAVKPALKLKIKIKKEGTEQSKGDKVKPKTPPKVTAVPGTVAGAVAGALLPEQVTAGSPLGLGVLQKTPKSKKKKNKDGETSSEEERWLDAIESGKLEEIDDELKKIKDPKLMTARQRAMLERKTDKEPSPGGDQLVALPSGYKEKVMTEEMLKKQALKSQKRRQLAEEKREKDKKKTMDRLLKKQESKNAKLSRPRGSRHQVPRISYNNQLSGVSISLPQGISFPLKPQIVADPPKPVLCGVEGCPNIKRYSCSKTGIPLCSISCYKANMENHSHINVATTVC